MSGYKKNPIEKFRIDQQVARQVPLGNQKVNLLKLLPIKGKKDVESIEKFLKQENAVPTLRAVFRSFHTDQMDLEEVFRSILEEIFSGESIYKEFTWHGTYSKGKLEATKITREIMDYCATTKQAKMERMDYETCMEFLNGIGKKFLDSHRDKDRRVARKREEDNSPPYRQGNEVVSYGSRSLEYETGSSANELATNEYLESVHVNVHRKRGRDYEESEYEYRFAKRVYKRN